MFVKRIEKANDLKQYQSLADQFGCVFNSSEWISIFNDQLLMMGVFNKDNKLIAAFLLYKTSMMGMPYITSPPYSPHNGFIVENRATNKSNQATYLKNIIETIADYFQKRKDAIFMTAFPYWLIDTQPFFWKNFKVIPNYTYRIDLALSVDQLSKNLTPDKRTSLKKVEKDGIRIEKCTDYSIVKELVLKSFSRKEKSLDTTLLDKIVVDFANSDNSFAFVAYNKQEPIAVTFCVFDNQTAYYLLGGYDAQNKHQGAGIATTWSAIIYAREMGLKVFDFEGSMIPEVEKYFRKFGGELTPYYTINKAWFPLELLLKFKKRTAF